MPSAIKASCLALSGLLSVVAGAADASADRGEFSFQSGVRWFTSDSVDALTADDSHGIVGVGAAYRLDLLRPFGLNLYAGLEYQHIGLDGVSYQRIESDLSVHALSATARAEQPMGRWLSLFGRAAIGYTTAALTLNDLGSNADRPLRDRAQTAFVGVGVGGEFQLVRHPHHVGLSLRAEVEYNRVGALHFNAEPEAGADDALPIPITAAPLGDLSLSGVGLRFGLVGRF